MFKSFGIFLMIGSAVAAQTAWAVCGCSNLTVAHTTGAQQIICSTTQKVFPECGERTGVHRTECTTTYEYACPVGMNNPKWSDSAPSQQTGFGVTATLTGTESDCTSGQMLALTIIGNSSVETNPNINPTNSTGAVGQLVSGITFNVDNTSTNQFPQYPIGGGTSTSPKFGGDNYRYSDNAAVLIERSRWWDNTDQGKDNQSEIASWKYKFVSFVKGSSTTQSSCACGFDIEVDWPANGNPTTTYTKDAAYSKNCTF